MSSQETALRPQEFWKEEGCPIIPLYGSISSGDLTPDLFFVALGAEPWQACQGMTAADCDEILSATSVAVDPEGCEQIVRGAISFATNETKTAAYIDNDPLSETAHGIDSLQPVIGEVDSPLDLPMAFASASLRDTGFVPPNLDNTGRMKLAGFAEDPVNETMVRAGFECVARSALGGCQLLFSRDGKASLADHVRYLRGIVEQASLGSLWERMERLRTFPALHGIAGMTYIVLDGEDPHVRSAIEEVALTSSKSDRIPAQPKRLVANIAERYDDLSSHLLAGRNAQDSQAIDLASDLIGLVIQGELDIDLASLLDLVTGKLRILAPAMTMDELREAARACLEKGLKEHLKTAQGISTRVACALPREARESPYRSCLWARALHEESVREDLSSLLESIVKLKAHFQAGKARVYDPALFEAESERPLWREYLKTEEKACPLHAQLDCEQAKDHRTLFEGSDRSLYERCRVT